MVTFNLKRFEEPDRLKCIKPERLVAFLEGFKTYLIGRGLRWPDADDTEIDCEHLVWILLNPDDYVPRRMVDALYFVHEMATPDGMDDLLHRIQNAGVELDEDPDMSPADVAIEVWLKAPELLELATAENIAKRKKSFEYYSGKRGAPQELQTPLREELATIEGELDAWFVTHKRGKGSRILPFGHGRKVHFIIRHGAPFRREGSVTEEGPSSEYYRPQVHDVAVYDMEADEIGIHAGTKGEIRLYLRMLGRHLFDDEEYFPEEPKFTVDPLHERGSEALNCEDVEGLESITLIQYQRMRRGKYKDLITHKATDVLASLAAQRQVLPNDRITKAVFAVKLSGADKARSVTLRPPNIALYEHDEDSTLLEQWMTRQGFMLRPPRKDDEAPAELLASD